MNRKSTQQSLPARGARRTHGGFTLVEALVALLALSIGLLGVAALQMTGLRSNISASWRSQATYLSYDIIDRIRANRDNRVSYVVGRGSPGAASGVVATDLADWKANLAATLPGGDGTVTVSGDQNTIITVTVEWDDTHGAISATNTTGADNDGETVLVFRTRTRI